MHAAAALFSRVSVPNFLPRKFKQRVHPVSSTSSMLSVSAALAAKADGLCCRMTGIYQEKSRQLGTMDRKRILDIPEGIFNI